MTLKNKTQEKEMEDELSYNFICAMRACCQVRISSHEDEKLNNGQVTGKIGNTS